MTTAQLSLFQATSNTVSIELTREQAITVYAALSKACNVCRDRQLQMLNLHESKSAGPVTRAEAWQTFKAWEKRENEVVDLLNAAKKAIGGELPFSAFRFG
jgi:hypothetical protein